jgi:hypothetical protein
VSAADHATHGGGKGKVAEPQVHVSVATAPVAPRNALKTASVVFALSNTDTRVERHSRIIFKKTPIRQINYSFHLIYIKSSSVKKRMYANLNVAIK